MPAKRILTAELIAKKARAAFRKHGPDLSVRQFATLSGFSVGIIQLRLGPWLRFKESLHLKPVPARPDRPTLEAREIYLELQKFAGSAPHVSLAAFTLATGYSEKTIVRHFGSWSHLKRLAKLPACRSGRAAVVRPVLIADLVRVARELKRFPTENDYARHGRFSVQTLTRRLGAWSTMPENVRLLLKSLAQEHPTRLAQARMLAKLQDPGFRPPAGFCSRWLADGGT